MEVSIIGVDIAKNVFQFHGASADGSIVFRRKIRRGCVLDFLSDEVQTELRPCFRTPGYFTPVHERGTKRDTIDGPIRTSIRQQRLSGFMNRARHRAALPGSLVSPAHS